MKRASSIYKLYVATGPYQTWAKTFGGTCPDPDFDAARHYWPKWAAREAQRHPALAAAGLAVVLLVAGSAVAIRRRRHPAPPFNCRRLRHRRRDRLPRRDGTGFACRSRRF